MRAFVLYLVLCGTQLVYSLAVCFHVVMSCVFAVPCGFVAICGSSSFDACLVPCPVQSAQPSPASPVQPCPVCFPPTGCFCLFYFLLLIKSPFPSAIGSSLFSIDPHPDRTNPPWRGPSGGRVCTIHHQPPHYPAPSTSASSSSRPWAPSVSRALT